MRSGIPLATLRNEVMIEAGLSAEAGHATFSAARINQMINRTERLMVVEEEWPDQHIETQVTAVADQQFMDIPADITFTNIETVHVSFGDDWIPVEFGIGARERSIYNSTQRATPIMRLEANANEPGKLEVWPIASHDQTLLFQGSKTVGTMVDEDDVCTLDGDVIVFRVAAQILGRDNQSDAALLLDMANTRTNQITKKQGAAKREPLNLGRTRKVNLRPGIDFIPSGGG